MTGDVTMQERVATVKQRTSLSALIGRTIKLRKRGREFEALCPFHQEKSPSFTIVDEKGFAHCFGCGWHGDAIRFVMDHSGASFRDALEALENDAGLAAESATRRESAKPKGAPSAYVDSLKAAAAVWGEGIRARGTIAERWFEARGIDPAASGALDVLRFHPRCPAGLWRCWEDPRDYHRHAPALIAPILRVAGGPGSRALSLRGVHITLLSGDGSEKAVFQPWQDRRTGEWRRRPARLMWGSTSRGAVLMPAQRLAPCSDVLAELVRLLDGGGDDPRLIVGEGLESTLSLARRENCGRMACAALSLNNLEGSARRFGKQGFEPLWNMQGDIDGSAPFTFEQPGRVVIGVDADMKPTQPKWVQERPRSLPVKRALSASDRAERCGALASWWWRRAGAERVSIVRPPMGGDFNDSDQQRVR